MPMSKERVKAGIVAKVVERAQARLKADESALAERFVRRFYADVPPNDLQDIESDTLYGAALSFLRFGAERRPGLPKVRVFNPGLGDDGWRAQHTIVEIVNDDMPFLVDSVTAELNRQELTVHLVIHPILSVRRREDGRLAEIVEPPGGDGRAESWMQVSVDERTDPADLAGIAAGIEGVLADVRAAVEDWRAMRQRSTALIEELSREAPPGVDPSVAREASEFLAWMEQDHFTYLGFREYNFERDGGELSAVPVESSGLGLFREARRSSSAFPRGIETLPGDLLAPLVEPVVLAITKARARSTIHRAVPMDYVAVQRFDADGRVVGEWRFLGLFTSVVYNTSPRRIPVLRRKVIECVARSGFVPNSHAEKALIHILETYPRDELFQTGVDELHAIASGIQHLQERQRIALFVRRDPFERFVSCLVYVPRERFDTALRLRFTSILTETFAGEVASFHTQVGDEPLARIHFLILTTPGGLPAHDPAEIESRLVEAGRTWSDRLYEALVADRGEERGVALFRRYVDAFSPAYRETFGAAVAVEDIDVIEGEAAADGMGLRLYRPIEAPASEIRFKVYHPARPIPLSDILPVLENMGLRVIGEVPYEVRPLGGTPCWLHDFELTVRSGETVDLRAVREAFHDSFAHAWRGEIENDGLNGLVLTARLGWRQIVILRALSRYLRQICIQFSQEYMAATLNRYPALACEIVALFEARFDPAQAAGDGVEAARARIAEAIDAVESLDDDRILRRFANLVEAALRTNHWQRGADGRPKPYLSIKLRSAEVDELPLPRPAFEIWVYSPRMEGIHLRCGKVARGGIRWSDRREDFRTEILGLMKAQQVKNTVIVPVGAKGGFVVKQPPADGGREALQAEAIECYKTLIRGMLDLTDNREGDTVVPPRDVVRRDDDDPYIVAAADKGTAAFSDIANGVSAEYGFWLGDAFASGGSAGYDHKGMGITARGAWESVKRHFREIGRDIQSEDFTCVGVGDMSGDVFGNGMLLSRHIRLIGAFNHLHVFVDPDPDPEASWAERERLFALPRSSWSDYDPALISRGGGVFERSAKSIALTPEIKAAFDIVADRVTPSQLMHHMLKAKVDLLWFGGIGTYVKAADESALEVGDRANDAIRIDGDEVRAAVIGEGANLGITQRGRIACALAGARLNTDFIDNSAGVDTSDHEVNIKILLGQAIAEGDMTVKQRDALLGEMTDEVGRLVLRTNYLQSQAISMAAAEASARLGDHAGFIRGLERAGLLDRAIEALPDDETLAEREAARIGLTRPEIAILISYAKLTLYDELLASTLPDEPQLAQDLIGYFPTPIRERFAGRVRGHRLAREIVAMLITNSVVDRAGPTFANRMAERTGRSVADVLRAYAIAVDIFDLKRLWAEIEALDTAVDAELQIQMLLESKRLIRWGSLWFLRNRPDTLDAAHEVAEFAPGIAALAEGLAGHVTDEAQERIEQRADGLARQGVPEALAVRIAGIDALQAGPDIVAISHYAEIEVAAAAAVYYAVGRRFHLDWSRAAVNRYDPGSAWERSAVDTFVEDFMGHQATLAAHVLAHGGDIDEWIGGRRTAVDRLDRLIAELQAADQVELAMLTVFNGHMRALLAA